MNGTTNFILYSMTEKGLPFGAALSEAQRLGYAEAEPSADIDGNDAQRKCAISASVAFEGAVAEDSVDVFGIRHITDLYVYLSAKPDLNKEYIEAELKNKDGTSEKTFSYKVKKQLRDMISINALLQIESAINKKVDMLMKMEDRMFLNPISKIKNIPKKAKEETPSEKWGKFGGGMSG